MNGPTTFVRCVFCVACVALCGIGRAEERVDPALAKSDAGDSTQWYDVRHLAVEGRGWTDTKAFYDRLPAKAEGVVRDAVWGLSRNSAGICARFVTDAPTIQARWTLNSA